MAGGSSTYSYHGDQAESSSSNHSPPSRVTIEDDSEDDNDPIANYSRDNELLHDDPLYQDDNPLVSFKRKQKQPVNSTFSNILKPFSNNSRSSASQNGSSPRRSSPDGDRATKDQGTGASHTKDGSPLDWYVEGPGRRVGYEDLTSIDWIFEYTKERQRLRMLHSRATGMLGYFQQLFDSSQIWLTLILTGLAAGVVAACIDIVSDWLGDLKTGYCSRGTDSGKFYLNKNFCCWGYADTASCQDWVPWSKALSVTSTGGVWTVEYIFFLAFSVLFATCASVLVASFAIHAKHSGIPEIKTVLSGLVIRRFMGTWTLIIKSIGLCLAVASGMWLGKEGPLVHVACCCSNLFMKLFTDIDSNEARKREVLSAAAAAGISVAFGSPIGGVLFSLEQLSYYFPDKTMWQSFVCAMTAAVTLQAFNPFRTGKLVLYQVTYTTGWHNFEMIPFALLGIFGGIYGGLFIRANMMVAEWKKSASKYLPGPVIQVILVALLTALINYPNLYMRAQSSELVFALFAECPKQGTDQFGLCKSGAATGGATIVLLIFACILGFSLAVVTFGLQIPAGIILPSMAIGALYGRAVGIVMAIWVKNYPDFIGFANCEPDVPCVTPGTYAIIGAAAALGGVTRMTVSIVVIMFELTGALTYVLPIMIAVMISKWVGDAITKRGIYESWIHFNEYPLLDNSEESQIPDIPVSQMMTRIEDLVVITAIGHTIESLKNLMATHTCRGFPIISNARDAILLGYISRADLSYNLDTARRELSIETECFFTHQPLSDPRTTLDLRPWMDQTPITLPARSSLSLTASYFQKLGLRYVMFTDRGVLQGLLTKKDVWYVLNGAEETRRTIGNDEAVLTGITREGGVGEQRGLLGRDNDYPTSPVSQHDDGTLL